MKGFPSFAAHLVPGLLVIGLASFGRPCVAQEVDAPCDAVDRARCSRPRATWRSIAPLHNRSL